MCHSRPPDCTDAITNEAPPQTVPTFKESSAPVPSLPRREPGDLTRVWAERLLHLPSAAQYAAHPT